MFRVLIGIGLIIISLVVMLVFLQGADNPLVKNVMTTLYCNPGETFGQSGVRRISTYCEDGAGNRRDMNTQSVLTSIIAFTAPFMLGLVLFSSGYSAAIRKRQQPNVISGAAVMSADLSPETAQTVEQLLREMDTMTNFPKGDLADKLRQLQTARNQGLITADEFERVRKEILNKLA